MARTSSLHDSGEIQMLLMMHRGWGYRRSVRENLKQNDSPTSMFSRLWDIEWGHPEMGLRASKVRTSPQTYFHSQSQPQSANKRKTTIWEVGGMQPENVLPKSLLLKRNIAAAGRQTICQPSSLLIAAKGWGPVSAAKSWSFLWDLVQLASDLLPSTVLGQWNQIIGSGFGDWGILASIGTWGVTAEIALIIRCSSSSNSFFLACSAAAASAFCSALCLSFSAWALKARSSCSSFLRELEEDEDERERERLLLVLTRPEELLRWHGFLGASYACS